MAGYRRVMISWVLLSVLWVPLPIQAAETMSVQVKETELRATPSFLGKTIAKLAYGDRVAVVQQTGPWQKVSVGKGSPEGWVHASALTTQRIVLKAGQTDVRSGTPQNELALAGKGFNDQVEASFIKQNKQLDYTWINKMETFNVPPERMNTFLAQGGVSSDKEGGAQ